MKNIQFHEKFTEKCPKAANMTKEMAATLGAGVQDGELFAAMAENNAVAVGGTNNV